MDSIEASGDEPDNVAGDDETAQPMGAGRWVESSWELRQGLTVREGLPPDAGLDEWLEATLRE